MNSRSISLGKVELNPKYRPEIDGLRAIAVVSVVLFHAQIEFFDRQPFRGGFLGVDIFFVVSGYLISLIIMSEIGKGAFTFAKFYERRARRILPALLATIGFTLVTAFVLFSPTDFERTAGAALTALIGLSNFYFLSEAGYFDVSAHVKPLLHTWSLSVEEQFYVVFPVLLLLLTTFLKKGINAALVALFISSIFYAEFASTHTPAASFYLLPMRGWELLAGALLAKRELDHGRTPHPTLIETMPWLGLVLIFASFLTFNTSTKHPSLMTALPVVGTMLIIWYAKPNTTISALLSSRVLVSLGLISYSLYLFHWPILVFAEYYLFRDLTTVEKLGAIGSALGIATLSYKYIEQPFRTRSPNESKKFRSPILVPALSAWVVLGGVSLVIWTNSGWTWRVNNDTAATDALYDVPEIVERSFALEEKWANHKWVSVKVVGDLDTAKVLFLGDSHTDHLVGLAEYLRHHQGVSSVFFSLIGCPPIFGTYKIFDYPAGQNNPLPHHTACKGVTKIWEDFVQTHADQFEYVALSSRWAWLFERGRYHNRIIRTDILVDKVEPKFDTESSKSTFESGLRRTLKKIKSLGLEPIVFSQVVNHERSLEGCDGLPKWFGGDAIRARCQIVPKKRVLARLAWTNQTIKRITAEEGVQAVIPTDYFCDNQGEYCRTHYGGVRLSDDADHINRFGSIYFAYRWSQSDDYPFSGTRQSSATP